MTAIHIASDGTEPFTYLMPSVELTGIRLLDADLTPSSTCSTPYVTLRTSQVAGRSMRSETRKEPCT